MVSENRIRVLCKHRDKVPLAYGDSPFECYHKKNLMHAALCRKSVRYKPSCAALRTALPDMVVSLGMGC